MLFRSAIIEGNKYLVSDFDTYSELTTFVATNNSFKAETDANDDLVMCLVMFSWATTQKYFKEIVTQDLRKQMQLENMNQLDELTPPAPMMDDGLEHDFMVEGGDLWEKADSGQTYAAYHRDFWRKL